MRYGCDEGNEMTMEQTRQYYKVPAKRGGRVLYTGGESPRYGTIRSAKGHYLRIQLDGDKHAGYYHPTWEIEYLADDGSDEK